MARFMIAGTGSGCGKTTLTAAILQALVDRSCSPASYKCGPDYIDTMYHTRITGRPARNLDSFLCPPDALRRFLLRGEAETGLAVIEGVMGFYDGIGGTSQASSCEISLQTETPVLLALRPKGTALSLAAVVQGFRGFQENRIAGLLLNGVSKGMYAFYKKILEEQTGLPVYGYLPELPEASFESRHLGLYTAGELADFQEKMRILSDAAKESLDLDGILALARTAPALDLSDQMEPWPVPDVRIGIARDAAFCFYYADGLEALCRAGAELVPFSPLEDAGLPEGISGLYIGGGYPELYAEALSANQAMRHAISAAAADGMPVVAECGGFLYLQNSLDHLQRSPEMEEPASLPLPMCGVVPGHAAMTRKLVRFGYCILEAQRDNLLCRAGERLHAHEFHYADSDCCGTDFLAQRAKGGEKWSCIHAGETWWIGFPHIHFGGNPKAAYRFIHAARRYQAEKIVKRGTEEC